ncbi:hypothetical protein [Paludibaculum fermentans]|uniref:hypothetical protein n=1 Tax=Paludibaculum fermentans TaxID=1473598 RepID=UPI003EB82015
MSRIHFPANISAMTSTAAVNIEKTAWSGWPNCYRISNGEVEMIVTADIGPRIMRFGYVGGQNLFWVQKETAGNSGEPTWIARGGHRIWVGPEDIRYTYPPDNSPIQVELKGDVLIATQPVEGETRIQKQLEIHLAPSGANATIIHRLVNTGNMPLQYAAWALSMMAPGGHGVTGFPPRGTHPEMLQPTNPLIMWAFSDLSDPRWTFTKKYLILRSEPGNKTPTKLAHHNPKTFGAYFLNGEMFLKQYDAAPREQHPDMGSSYETFTNADFLEMETLGPLTQVEPGGTLEHVERWSLHNNVVPSPWNDAELDRILLPILASK